jgi:hypothetical protein
MAGPAKIDEALARFEAALRSVEAAVKRAGENHREAMTTHAEAEALRDDRARLAGEIHDVRSKAADLADKHRQATARIDTAMEKIRAVIGG